MINLNSFNGQISLTFLRLFTFLKLRLLKRETVEICKSADSMKLGKSRLESRCSSNKSIKLKIS